MQIVVDKKYIIIIKSNYEEKNERDDIIVIKCFEYDIPLVEFQCWTYVRTNVCVWWGKVVFFTVRASFL